VRLVLPCNISDIRKGMDTLLVNEIQASTKTPPVTVSQSEFTDCVDRYVASLLTKPVAAPQEPAQLQLRAWLAGDRHALEDGRPINFALFDSTILSVEERLPAAGSLARTQLLSAARQLAETLYVNARATVET
jgi:hypothetical protein